ncbi:long-chain-fatty-acid--CoA ligase [Carboxydothermus islandicus]|uniref:Long-chain-fatty-acid--CoA ligase n=1 Tax=Carboxydothermus islandicus TaxID=661089 RepID=A0A1L8D0T6_9THEO|nr:long-chain fatty acid--CoA ligase [Carboxydothermus islandicus]GAV24749.1 long-chain-fatty-acid--CoA ligase [Carboxydothermus islandicus]
MKGLMMDDYPLTMITILERVAKYFANHEIVTRRPDRTLHRYTYGEFYRRSHKLASALVKAGIKPGDRVATLMWNSYSHLEAYFGIPITGAVMHTLNLRLSPQDLAYIINHAEDRFIILEDVLLPLFEQVKNQINVEKVIVVPFSGKPVPGEYIDYEQFLATGDESFSYPKIAETDAAAMCYTSGTTGRPKGVLYSHRSLMLHSFGLALPDSIGISMYDTLMPVVPMFHVNAWCIPYVAVMVGAKMVMPGPYLDPASLVDLFEKEQVTLSAGVPTIWAGIIDLLDQNPGKFKFAPNLRLVVGGAAVPEAIIRRFDKHGITVIHAWGMTETTPLGTVARIKPEHLTESEDRKYQIRATQGLPVPFVEARVVDGEGNVVPEDGKTFGELQVRGPWIAAQYYKGENTGKWTEDGWFRTEDVAVVEPGGYIRLVDRTKDVIKSGGEWISSVQLENALMGHPAVKEAAVIAVYDPKWQERPLAAVVLREGMTATPDELREFLAPKFAKWWLPDYFVFVEQLPKTSTGKIAKVQLREMFKDWKPENN